MKKKSIGLIGLLLFALLSLTSCNKKEEKNVERGTNTTSSVSVDVTEMSQDITETSQKTSTSEKEIHTISVVNSHGSILKEIKVKNGDSVDINAITKELGNTTGWLGDTEKITSDGTVEEISIKNPQGFAFLASDIESAAGNDAVVSVYAQDNPGIIGAMITLTYDESALTLTEARPGNAFPSLHLTQPGEYKNGCNFVWDATSADADGSKEGTLLNLYFKVKEDVPLGRYEIVLSCREKDIINNNLETFKPGIKNGSIIIK